MSVQHPHSGPVEHDILIVELHLLYSLLRSTGAGITAYLRASDEVTPMVRDLAFAVADSLAAVEGVAVWRFDDAQGRVVLVRSYRRARD